MTNLPPHLAAMQEFFDAMSDLMTAGAPVQRKTSCRANGETEMPIAAWNRRAHATLGAQGHTQED